MTTTNGAVAQRMEVVESARSLSDAASRLGDVIESENRSVPMANFGTICVEVSQLHFRPGRPHGMPPSTIAEKLSHKTARELAIQLNRDNRENDRRFWHFLIVSKCGWHGVLRVPIAPHEMPKCAEDYRDGDDVSCGVGKAALEQAESLNKQIRQVAFTAKRWNVVIRSLKDEPAT